jgi:hypothetical protein
MKCHRFFVVVAWAIVVFTGQAAGSTETLGQCSRLTSLVISEIMYHPGNFLVPTNGGRLEFVELYNSRAEPEDISGYRISGAVEFTFPPNTSIPGSGFLVVARSPADVAQAYGISGVLGPWVGAETNGLPNNEGAVRLRHRAGAVFLEINYGSKSPWPVAADGAGHSLVLARPSYGERDPRAWAASDRVGGSPGAWNPTPADPLDGVVINELLAHTDPPLEDFIELYNHSNGPKDISGSWLSDDPATNKFRIPDNTTLPARGFVAFPQTQLGFALSAAGERLLLVNSNRTRVVDAIDFSPQENGIAFGRVPDGGPGFYRLAAPTAGTNNAAPLDSPVVINEIMFNPASGLDDHQYVELFNGSGAAVDIGGWRLSGGISFTFPPHTRLSAGACLAVCRNVSTLRSNYAQLNLTNSIGDFSGRLSHGGEKLILAMPHADLLTNGVNVVTNIMYIALNEVSFSDAGHWSRWADGGGSSLELIHPGADSRFAANWADSDETEKAPWTLVSRTGTIDNGSVTADQLQVLLSGPGECLIDDVQVLGTSGNNLIANSSFDADASEWTAEGTESRSSWESTGGFGGGGCYHVRAVERGDNQVNRIRTPLTASLGAGSLNVTIRARVRWLKGAPEITFRLRGNWLECAASFDLPVNAGTPGLPNSRLLANAPPAVSDVHHSPVLPATGESIRVIARVNDPDGIASVHLKYRLDPGTTFNTVTMQDNGTGGDEVAGDGIFSGTIPGQANGAMIAFHLVATDKRAAPASVTFPVTAPGNECLVRVAELQPSGTFPVYRMWMTQKALNTWTSRSKMDNSPLEVTFVVGNQRAIYGAEALYAGSPHIAPSYCGPACGRCGYSVSMPADDLFLGERDLVLDWPGGHGGETSAMQEQMGYWLADRLDLAYAHRYTIRLHVNGVTDDSRSHVFEAVMQPAGSFARAWSPEAPDGKLYKIDQAFEFADSGGAVTFPAPRLQNFTTTGGLKKREKYRWNFNCRSMQLTQDYTNIFALVDALNAASPEPYTSATYGLVDVEQWMRVFAAEHIMVNFDAYGHQIGKNMYAFQPDGGKWQLYMFDLDWLMLAATRYNSSYAASSAPLFNAEDPTITRMYGHPPFLRAYWRAVEDAVNGPLDPAICNPVMDAKYASLVNNGIRYCDGQALTPPNDVKQWFAQRRTFLQNQLATVASPFSITDVTISNNVAILTGRAPVTAATLQLNGTNWPVTWTSTTAWQAIVPLHPGNNQFTVTGIDLRGSLIPGATAGTSVTYTGQAPPTGLVALNEIMYAPARADGEYVEFFNTSSQYFIDLSGCSVRGLNYDFAPGSMIAPHAYLLLVKDREAFDSVYGGTVRVFDQYRGNLRKGGELVGLAVSGPIGTERLLAPLAYEPSLPWPTNAFGTGSSLQLIDARQDNWRVGNWAAVATNPAGTMTPKWVYVTVTGSASATPRLYIYLGAAGDIYVDDVKLVAGSVAEQGQNIIVNGDFETDLGAAWTATANFTGSAISSEEKYGGSASLHLVSSAAGSGSGNALYQDLSPAPVGGQTYTLSFWYLEKEDGSPLTVRMSGTGLTAGPINPSPGRVIFFATPGATNSVTASLAPFEPLWINEVQGQNLTGITNRVGQRVPWIELVNPTAQTVSLKDLYLANNYTNLLQWTFPSNSVLSPGEFRVVFADAQPGLSTASEWHASFTLGPGAGAVALSRLGTNLYPQVLDYLNYTNLGPDHSFGSVPDAQSFERREFVYVTPGATNNPASLPIAVKINEWMADNTATRQDPADNKFQDWFELYNPAAVAVDLGGYYLSDALTNKNQFQIPNNHQYIIPPNGYLLVWADDEEETQNSTETAALHVNFKLEKSGETIGLFGADGAVVDYVTFAAQTNDVSQGRYPDGAGAVFFMTTPTPLLPNVVPNTPPVLDPIADRFAILGQSLSLAISATDSDVPAQLLAFALTAPPPGAAINAFSGVFSWTPAALGTYVVNVGVTDNGTPPLSNGRTFKITVLEPPRLDQFAFGDPPNLTFASVAGVRYQLEYAESLETGEWIASGAVVVGNGASMTLPLPVGNSASRFYRLQILGW